MWIKVGEGVWFLGVVLPTSRSAGRAGFAPAHQARAAARGRCRPARSAGASAAGLHDERPRSRHSSSVLRWRPCCCTMPTPAARAARRSQLATSTGLPATRRLPPSPRTTPARIFTSVDFPAPFSPTQRVHRTPAHCQSARGSAPGSCRSACRAPRSPSRRPRRRLGPFAGFVADGRRALRGCCGHSNGTWILPAMICSPSGVDLSRHIDRQHLPVVLVGYKPDPVLRQPEIVRARRGTCRR